ADEPARIERQGSVGGELRSGGGLYGGVVAALEAHAADAILDDVVPDDDVLVDVPVSVLEVAELEHNRYAQLSVDPAVLQDVPFEQDIPPVFQLEVVLRVVARAHPVE